MKTYKYKNNSNPIVKILITIMTVIFVFSYTTYAYADEITPKLSFSATIQIVSRPSGSNSDSSGITGHSFLVVKNVGNSSIMVGHMSVPVGGSVTVGTFNTRENHKGIWYNYEGYTGPKGTCYGFTTGLTGSQVATMNSTINAHNEWTLTKNCSYFAKTVWNSVNSTYKVSGTNPLTLANSIKKLQDYVKNPTIPSKEKSEIAMHTSNGVKYPYNSKSMVPDLYISSINDNYITKSESVFA